MNFKTTYILFGALVVMVGALLIALMMGKSDNKDEDRLFPSASGKDRELSSEDITKVVIQRTKPADSDIVLERDGKNWKITSPRPLPAENNRVTTLIDSVLNARIDSMSNPKSLKDGGLDSPSRVITLHGKDKTLKLTVGDVPPGSEAPAFVLSSDLPKKPLAVKKREIASALEEVGYFRVKELLGENTFDIDRIKISDPKKGTVELAKEKEQWRFVQPSYGDASVDAVWLNQLNALAVEYKDDKENDFVKDEVTDLSTIDKDLPKSEELRIEVSRGKDKTTLAVLLGKKLTEKLGDKYYAYVDGGKTKDVVKVSARSVEPLLKLLADPSALRNKNLMALGQSPDAIDVDNKDRVDGLLEFRKPEGSINWTMYRGTSAINPDRTEMRLLIDSINRKDQVVSFPDPKRRKELGLDQPKVIVKVWADSLVKPEEDKDEKDKKEKDKKDKDKKEKKVEKKTEKPVFKKDATPIVELRFGKTEAGQVAVERIWGKESTIVMVPESLLEQVQKKPLAYYEKNIPPFSTQFPPDAEVTRIEFRRGGIDYELVREKRGTPWKITKPANQKDRVASQSVVLEILNAVNRLNVEEIATDKASATELDSKYGLKNPKYRVVVTVTRDMKDTKHEYDFGNETKGKDGKAVYAKVSGKDAVYVVDDLPLTALAKELRDTTVFDFDAEKVTSVKLTGWKKLLGAPETRTLEKKDGKWTVKEKPTFVVDEAKVKQALEGLSHLQAERFVAAGQGMTLNDDALQIEVKVDDKTYDLTLGAAEGTNYYATSSQIKGEAFLVNQNLFKDVRTSPGYFGK